MIEIKNLTKKFGNTTILDHISLEVKKGEILGFLGPNGAGKSTTMKIITSFWTPTSGSVLIDGVNITQDTLVSRAKIGYLPETVPLYEDMRVYEYLKFIAEVRGIAKDKIRERIKEVVSDCGLSKVIRKPIEELSKGYRQRAGLDPNQITEIRDLIKKIGKEKTVIFSTHILGEVSATCDRVVIINNGKIVGEGNPNELAQKIGSKELIYVKIKGPKAEVETALRDLENVEKVESKDRESENIFGYEIEPKAGVDLREALSQTVMNKNWSILEFSKKSMSLED